MTTPRVPADHKSLRSLGVGPNAGSSTALDPHTWVANITTDGSTPTYSCSACHITARNPEEVTLLCDPQMGTNKRKRSYRGILSTDRQVIPTTPRPPDAYPTPRDPSDRRPNRPRRIGHDGPDNNDALFVPRAGRKSSNAHLTGLGSTSSDIPITAPRPTEGSN